MRTSLLLLTFFFISIFSFGQVKFEKGYFINNENIKTICLIQNNDWKNNPIEFEYKLDENDKPKKANIDNINEFGVFGFSKYIRVEVQIDRSPMELSRLSYSRNPIWSKEKLFLKVILEGKASLYYYSEEKLYRCFYSINNSQIKQLVYKQYLYNETFLSDNNEFRQQLWNEIKCDSSNINSVQQIKYRLSELRSYFKKFNECTGDSTTFYEKNEKKINFNIKVTSGVNYSTLSIINSSGFYPNINSTNVGFRMSIETELVLPFNKNKWGLLFEPTYQNFTYENKSVDFTYENKSVDIQLHTIEIPVGFRHNFFLNDKSKIFLNAHYIASFSKAFNSHINFGKDWSMEISPGSSYALGGGIEYKKISAELRYNTDRNLLTPYPLWHTKYARFSIIIGFKLIHTKRN